MRVSIVSGDGSVTYTETISQAENTAAVTEDFSQTLETATANLSNSYQGISAGGDLESFFQEAADTYGVDVQLLKAMAKQESNFQSDATSSSGAQGIMQLMPATAESLGVENAYDPYQNIMGGAKYISKLLSQYNGDVSLALAAYNAGSGNVAKYGGIPPFEETQNYVKKVQQYYAQGVEVPQTTVESGSVSKEQTAEKLIRLLDEFPDHASYSVFIEQLQALESQPSERTQETSEAQVAYQKLLQKTNQAVLNTISAME